MVKSKKRDTPPYASADKKRPTQSAPSLTNIYAAFFCVLCTFAVYIYSALHNQFTNWDDGLYVINNTFIKSWGAGLFTATFDGNWAPVHQLVLALQYHLFGLNPAGYHITSLLLHLCNVTLVFAVLLKLSNKPVVAIIVALFFGIHPMHVESVAWVSEQKDLLYTLFYLAAMLMYLKHKEHHTGTGNSGKKFLLLTAMFFILSCLSKGMGVTLPIALVLIDSLQENTQGFKFLLQRALAKSAFFAISIVFGVGAFITQKHAGTLNDTLYHPFGAQIMFASYGLVVYLVKFILPFFLCPLYPYPLKGATGSYPVTYYLSPVIIVLIASLTLWVVIGRKRKGQSNSILFFGAMFFLANILLVLQIKSVGHVLLAERYTYLSYFGLLFIAAVMLNNFWERYFYQYRAVIIVGACLLISVFGYCTYSYTSVWYNSITLWTRAIDKFQSVPMEAMEIPYNNRGIAYGEQGKTDSASADYSAAININPSFPDAYNNRGFCYAMLGKTGLAIVDYNKAIALRPAYSSAYFNRGLAYEVIGKPDSAIADYTTAINQSPDFATAYSRRGLTYASLRKFDNAIADYTAAIATDSHFATAYNNRGLAYEDLGKFEMAIADYDMAIGLNPQYAEAFYNQGRAYARQGKFDLTIAKNTAAINLDLKYFQAYNNRGLAYANLGKFDLAIADYNAAIALNPQFVDAYSNRGLAHADLSQPDLAIADYNRVISLNPMYGLAYYRRGLAEERKGSNAQAQLDMEKAKTLGVSVK